MDVGKKKRGSWLQKLNPARLLRRYKAAREVMVNVGIDFGTSSTKVLLRDLYAQKAYLYAHDHGIDEFGPFCWPSTIRVKDGRLYFGAAAEKNGQGEALRSFKVCLGCECGLFKDRSCASDQCTADGQRGRFRFGNRTPNSTVLGAQEIIILYLANLLAKMTSDLEGVPPLDGECRLTYNMAAPLDMIEKPILEEAFGRALYCAERLKGQIRQGISIQDAKALAEKELARCPKLPNEAERSTFIIPETHAAMVGYVISGKAQPGLYALIDVGAGTTDIAVFRYGVMSGKRQVAYYSASTAVVAADDIDREILRLALKNLRLQGNADELRATVRRAKHSFGADGLTIKRGRLGAQEVVAATSGVVDGIFRHYRVTWYTGFRKEHRATRWSEMAVLLTGGGNELPFVQSRLAADPGKDMGGIVLNPQPVRIELPTDLTVVGFQASDDLPQYASLLTVAHGLSFHVAFNPKYFLPYEVEPIPEQRGIVQRDDPWER